MKIAIISANLDRFDKSFENKDQKILQGDELSMHYFQDKNFPPRSVAMTPRMQAKIPKCFGWQLVPDKDIYIWMDASFALFNTEAVLWFIGQLGDKEAAFFKHPTRMTVGEEWQFLNNSKSSYIKKRYDGELRGDWLDGEILLAAGVFIYRNTPAAKAMLKEWWYHISRYHLNDQLSLSSAIRWSGCVYNIINENIYTNPYFTYTRTREYLNG